MQVMETKQQCILFEYDKPEDSTVVLTQYLNTNYYYVVLTQDQSNRLKSIKLNSVDYAKVKTTTEVFATPETFYTGYYDNKWLAIVNKKYARVYAMIKEEITGGVNRSLLGTKNNTLSLSEVTNQGEFGLVVSDCLLSVKGLYIIMTAAGVCKYSCDGVTWSTASGVPAGTYYKIIYNNDNDTFYAFYKTATTIYKLAVSTDNCATWSAGATLPARGIFNYANDVYILIGASYLYTSTNTIDWVQNALPAGLTCYDPYYQQEIVCTYKNKFYYYKYNGAAATDKIYSSGDGVNWTITDLFYATDNTVAMARPYTGVVMCAGDDRIVIIRNGATYKRIFTTTDGATWSDAGVMPVYHSCDTFMSLSYGGGYFFAGGIQNYNGYDYVNVIYSVTGSAWTELTYLYKLGAGLNMRINVLANNRLMFPDDNLVLGISTGFSQNTKNPYKAGSYYDPRLSKIFPLKKSIDALFYGLLKFSGGEISLINTDGKFDDWRERQLYAQACRILIGAADADYTDLKIISSGFIENDNRDFNNLNVTMQDIRKSLTTPVTVNNYTASDLVDPEDNNIDKPKPIAYGKQKNAPCICLSNKATIPTNVVYHFCDTTYHPVSSIQQVYCNGEPFATVTTDLAAGTFTIAKAGVLKDGSTIADNLDGITIDFTTAITNGVAIIKDLLKIYSGKTFIDSFFDVNEVNIAEAAALNTSLYIDSETKLADAIESVCRDISARFYYTDDGRYTIRLYDSERIPIKTIKRDDFFGSPTFDNNGSEFLTSAIVQYNHNIKDDTYSQVEYKVDEAAAYARYKTYKKEIFKTNLISASDATAKAKNIMAWSSNVTDIVVRSTHWEHSDLTVTDFVICDPVTRLNQTEQKAVYEIIGIVKDPEKLSVTLTLRKVSNAVPIDLHYKVRTTTDGSTRTTSSGLLRSAGEI